MEGERWIWHCYTLPPLSCAYPTLPCPTLPCPTLPRPVSAPRQAHRAITSSSSVQGSRQAEEVPKKTSGDACTVPGVEGPRHCYIHPPSARVAISGLRKKERRIHRHQSHGGRGRKGREGGTEGGGGARGVAKKAWLTATVCHSS